MTSVIRTAVNMAVANLFKSAVLQTAVKQAVHECVVEPDIVDAVATNTIEAPFFTVRWPTLLNKRSKGLLLRVHDRERYVKLANAVPEKRSKQEDGFPTRERVQLISLNAQWIFPIKARPTGRYTAG